MIAVLYLFLFSLFGLAAELNDEAIRNAKTIAIYPGTFDPFNLGHQDTAETVIERNMADLVILLPNPTHIEKTPLPVPLRLNLIHEVHSEDARIVYPKGDWEKFTDSAQDFMARVREINPNAKISVVVGQDITESKITMLNLYRKFRPQEFVAIGRAGIAVEEKNWPVPVRAMAEREGAERSASSTKVREFLIQNKDLYGQENIPKERIASKLVDERVARKIFRDGMYIDQIDSTKSGVVDHLAGQLNRVGYRLGIRSYIRELLVSLMKNPDLKSYTINGKVLEVEKHLGSGLNGDAYLVKMGEEKFVLKVAKPGEKKSLKVIRQDQPVREFLEKHTTIHLPKLIDMDPIGAWTLSEFIDGNSLEKVLKENGGEIPAYLRSNLKALYTEADRFRRSSGVNLDISVDNIFVRKNGEVVLVDPGPTRRDSIFPGSFEEVETVWRGGRLKQHCEHLFQFLAVTPI